MTLHVDLRVEDARWDSLENLQGLCERALSTAFEGTAGVAHVDVLLADDDALEALNTQWRGKAKPTDVLSFPAEENPEHFLGDIAVAYGVCAKDADAGNKTLSAHLSHLLIHGLLHLQGHDHIADEDAETMEALERAALAKLGIDDPYSRIVAD